MSIIPCKDLDIEAYHKAPWVSHSKLQTFARGGARLFHLAHVQQAFPARPDTEALRFGKAFEMLAFHPKDFAARYVQKPPKQNPDGSLNKEADGRYVEGKAWKQAHAHIPEENILDASEITRMREMSAALEENSTAMALLKACEEQVTYTTEYRAKNGEVIEVASRMDYSSRSGCAASGFRPFLLDLKTTDKLESFRTGHAFVNFGHHSQMSLGTWCMESNLPDVGLPMGLLVAVEKQLPHRCEIFSLDDLALDIGWNWCQEQLEGIAFHRRAGEWPRVNLEIQRVGLPRWKERAAEYEAADAEGD